MEKTKTLFKVNDYFLTDEGGIFQGGFKRNTFDNSNDTNITT